MAMAAGAIRAEGRPARWPFARTAQPWLALVVCLSATGLATLDALRRERAVDEVRFTHRARDLEHALTDRMGNYTQILRSAGGLLAVNPELTPDQWQVYFEHLDLSLAFNGVHVFGYVECVPRADLEKFITSLRGVPSRHSGFDNFHVWPDSAEEWLFPVKFLEPYDSNSAALGFDIASEAFRREAADRARDTGEPALTRPIHLVQAQKPSAVLLLCPVYRPGPPPLSVAERRSRLQGWVDAALFVDDLMRDILRDGEETGLEVYDGQELLPDRLLYRSHSSADLATAGGVRMRRSTNLFFGGRTWTLRLTGFARTTAYSPPRLVALAGLCISFLTFGIARSLASSEQRALSMAQQMTERLRLRERAIASSNEGIVILGATEGFPIIYSNPAFLAMMGYTPPEILAGDTVSLFEKAVHEPDLPALLEALKTGHEKRAVLREHRKDGTLCWVDLRLSPVRDNTGITTHFLGIIENITERKKAEEQLAQALKRYRHLVNNLTVGIARSSVGPAGRFVEANPALVAMCEAETREELLQHPVSDLYVDPAEAAELTTALVEKGVVRSREIQLRTLKGRVFWAALSASRVTDDEGGLFVDGVVEDITERKRAEQALRESQERFALAVQGTNDGIWDWNVVTGEVYFSPRWKAMLGYEGDEIGSNFQAWERLLHPDDRDRALAFIDAYFRGQTSVYELEHRLRHKDGTYRWILSRGVAVRDAQGNPLRMAGSHLDLTGRKLAEEELRRANTELAQSRESLNCALEKLKTSHEELKATQLQLIQAAKLESVGTLAAGVAHEVKNPLQIILLGLDYLEADPASSSLHSLLQQMRDAVIRANSIVRELLQLSAVTALELKDEDVNALTERALWLVNYEAEASKVRIVKDLGHGLPLVRLDHAKIEQALINVFLNAIQAMEQGGVLTVRTRADLQGRNNGSAESRLGRIVSVEITDTGPGIPKENLPRIFDPFFTTKPLGVGTGLGLPIVKKIVELHRAELEVRNVPGAGTSVTFAFTTAAHDTVSI